MKTLSQGEIKTYLCREPTPNDTFRVYTDASTG